MKAKKPALWQKASFLNLVLILSKILFLFLNSIPQMNAFRKYFSSRSLSLNLFYKGPTNSLSCLLKRKARISQSLLRPGYILLWERKTHPGRPPSPAYDLCQKCLSTRARLEHD